MVNGDTVTIAGSCNTKPMGVLIISGKSNVTVCFS